MLSSGDSGNELLQSFHLFLLLLTARLKFSNFDFSVNFTCKNEEDDSVKEKESITRRAYLIMMMMMVTCYFPVFCSSSMVLACVYVPGDISGICRHVSQRRAERKKQISGNMATF